MTTDSTKTLKPKVLESQLDLPFEQEEMAQDLMIEELSSRCPESKAMISYLTVGVDTSRRPVRMMCASTSYDHCQGNVTICPHDTAEFTTLEEFSSNWALRIGRGVHVAVPNEEADPLGIRRWLECSGERVERYDWWSYRAHLRNDLTLENMGIDSEFRRAYVLALYSGYRRRADVISRSIWARLLEAHHLLDDVRRDAHRLAAALDDTSPGLDEIPF